MTQLKFSLNQIMNACNMKFETQLPGMYKAMETYKPFLFLETNQVLAAPAYTEHLPPLVVIHTLFVRAYSHHLFLPMQLYQWSEQQYSDWIDTQYLVHQLKLNELKENGGGDGSPMFVIPPPIIQILSQSISQYEQQVKAIGVKEYCMEYPVINALLYKEVQ